MEDERPDDGADTSGSGVGGRIKEAVGWATGDREVEAKGRAQQQASDEDQPDPPPVDDLEIEVRKDHGDIAT